jgi:VanZ family protein
MIRKSILYIYLLALVVANFLPSKAISVLHNKDIFSFRLDYVLHALSFLGLVVLMKLAYRLSFRKYLRPSLLALFIAILLAVVLEVIQLWVPSRTFNPVDMACNMGGALVGGIALAIYGILSRP